MELWKILMYADIGMKIKSTYPKGAHKNPDVCGHKHQLCLYVDIELHIQGGHCSGTMENPDV